MSRTCPVLVLDSNVTRNNMLSQLLVRHQSVRYAIPIYSLDAGMQFLQGAALKLIYIHADDLNDNDFFNFIETAFREIDGVSVVLMTSDLEPQRILRAAERGITGFMFHDENPFILFQSLQQMTDFGAYIHPLIVPLFLKNVSAEKNDQLTEDDLANTSQEEAISEVRDTSDLTPREQDVLTYLAKGFTASEIATSLGISAHTVASHTKNVYRKLAIHTKGEAIVEAIRMGLVTVDCINSPSVPVNPVLPMDVKRKSTVLPAEHVCRSVKT